MNQNIPRPSGPKLNRIIMFAVLALFLVFTLTNTTFLTIPSGHKGVLFKPFAGGLNKEKIYGQGFHVVAPWNRMYVYDVRVSQGMERMDVLSRNGLSINIELTYRCRPLANKIGYLHDEVGVDYLESIVKPEIRSATREVIGKYLPEELYSSKRENIQEEIFAQTKLGIGRKNLELDAILIREVSLPQSLKDAIERKLKEEQASLEYEFRLQQERQEAERVFIEAEAKAKANRILAASLTDKILQDKGIDATLKLAESPNSKVVIVGSSKDGLPLILGNE